MGNALLDKKILIYPIYPIYPIKIIPEVYSN